MKNKTLQDRLARLMPAGVPRYVRAYDNGGASVDRYTVLFTGRAADRRWKDGAYYYQALAMNAAPFHPQGFGQHCECPDGAHLGKRISFAALPEDCRKLVLQDYREIWRLNPEGAP